MTSSHTVCFMTSITLNDHALHVLYQYDTCYAQKRWV